MAQTDLNTAQGAVLSPLGERLTQLQTRRNVLKRDIADAAGISIMALYRYERGDRHPPADILISIADYFDVSLDYLVGRSDNPERT